MHVTLIISHPIGHSVSWGYPLCAHEDLAEVIRTYLTWLRHHHLKPIWLNVDARTEKILSEEMGWRALSVTADQRLSPIDPITRANKHVLRKIRAAERAGMTVKMVKGEISTELRQHIDERVNDWEEAREGTQIHTTQVRP
jgi:aspartyl-tRNA synthetase